MRGGGSALGTPSLRTAVRSGGARQGTAATASWQRGRQFFSQDPVHFPTGTVLLPQTDVELPGVLPLRLERTHLSTYRTGRCFGRSWASTLDQRLEADADGLCLGTETGALLTFPYPEQDRPAYPDEGPRLALRETDDGYTVTDPSPAGPRTSPRRPRPACCPSPRSPTATATAWTCATPTACPARSSTPAATTWTSRRPRAASWRSGCAAPASGCSPTPTTRPAT
ncbi:DUF6531 domain-containing protein [Nonomuraea thailandensis]